MTAATVTETDGMYVPGLKFGTISAANAYTTKFGFASLRGAVVSTSSDNDAIVGAIVGGGSATLTAVDDAGSAVTTAFTINFIAWGDK